jgi:hypothetical protein
MRGRTLARVAVATQAIVLAGALVVPASVAAATLDFTINTPTLATVQYSDFDVLRGAYTCINDSTSVCPTTIQSRSATFSIRPSGGSAFTNVGTVASSFSFTGSAGGCPTTCSQPFQLTWKAGRALGATVPPGVYDLGLTTTIAAGQLVLLGAITVTAEQTNTTYLGATSGMGNTPLALSGSVLDKDLGQAAGTGIFSPDANLAGADEVTFELFDSTNTTSVAGPVSAFLAAGGTTSGSPSLVLPPAGGTFKLRTTFVGNGFYTASSDLDTISVTPSNTPPVLSVPVGPVIAEATSPGGASVTYSVSAIDAEDNPDPTPSCGPSSGSLFGLGDTTVNCSVTDTGGLSDTDSFTVRVVDTTDPGVSITTTESDNGAGWYNLASNDGAPGLTVDVSTADLVGVTSLACTDNGGDVGALDPGGDSFVLGDGAHAISCSATDGAGNHASDAASFDIDQTPPSISAALSPDADASGWWNLGTGAPTVTYACSDSGGSGIASCSSPHAFGEGAGQGDTGTAVDVAGNSSSASVSNVNVDLTAPTISASISPNADAATGWWNIATGAPTVTYTCGDPGGSGIASCSPPHAFGEGADQGDTGTAVDAAGNANSASVSNVDVDLSAPSISASVAPNADAATGWWNAATGAPTATYTCGDAGSGLTTCSPAHLFGDGADQGDTGTAVDVAGNSSTAAVSNVNVDLVAPTGLAFVGGGLANGGSYVFGAVPAAPSGCVASGGPSGLTGCLVAGYSAAIGIHVVTALATDGAGNAASSILTYTVVPWTLVGFANPVSMVALNPAKAGATANLKFQVFAGGTELTTLDAIAAFTQTQRSCTTLAPIGPTTSALLAKGASLRYSTQFQAKWDPPASPNTCWAVAIVTADGSSLTALFQLK